MNQELIDTVLREQYRFIKELKSSEKSHICVYQHKELGRTLIKRSVEGPEEVFMLLRSLFHPNIANVYDAVKVKDKVIVLEEYVDGQTVAEFLQDNLYSPIGVKKIISTLCDALHFLHQNKIIHKDIKPENIMIDNNGNVKLIDFDAARIYKPQKSEDTKIMGTTGYAAPEQYGLNQSDERTDIFALGVLMNVMLTGEIPERKIYQGKLKKVIVKCTQTIPNNRYQNVLELKKSL